MRPVSCVTYRLYWGRSESVRPEFRRLKGRVQCFLCSNPDFMNDSVKLSVLPGFHWINEKNGGSDEGRQVSQRETKIKWSEETQQKEISAPRWRRHVVM